MLPLSFWSSQSHLKPCFKLQTGWGLPMHMCGGHKSLLFSSSPWWQLPSLPRVPLPGKAQCLFPSLHSDTCLESCGSLVPGSTLSVKTGLAGHLREQAQAKSHYCSLDGGILSSVSFQTFGDPSALFKTVWGGQACAQAEHQGQASEAGHRVGSADIGLLKAGTYGRLMLQVTPVFLMP